MGEHLALYEVASGTLADGSVYDKSFFTTRASEPSLRPSKTYVLPKGCCDSRLQMLLESRTLVSGRIEWLRCVAEGKHRVLK